MTRKICTALTALALFAALCLPASALQDVCREETRRSAASQAQACSDTPSVPDVPSLPDAPEQSGVSAEEAAVLALVNDIRAQYALSPLSLDPALCRYARVKSQDMHDAGYFSHNSPLYGSPFDMMRSFGLSYNHAGENIAKGYFSAEAVVRAWMNSEGHRANLLSADYSRLGVGYVADGGYWTQWFLG